MSGDGPVDSRVEELARILSEDLHAQVDRLARVILEDFGGPDAGESTCDAAVRLLRQLHLDASVQDARVLNEVRQRRDHALERRQRSSSVRCRRRHQGAAEALTSFERWLVRQELSKGDDR